MNPVSSLADLERRDTPGCSRRQQRTMASVYSVRPHPRAAVSMPVRWEEATKGLRLEDFRIDNAPAQVRRRGDLWKPLLSNRGKVRLERFL